VLHRRVEPAQYLTIRYTGRLDAAGAVRTVGSKGDSYDPCRRVPHRPLQDRAHSPPHPWRGLGEVELTILNTPTGSTTAASTAPAATSRQSSTRTTTTVRSPDSPRTNRQNRQNRQNRASTEPGAVHYQQRRWADVASRQQQPCRSHGGHRLSGGHSAALRGQRDRHSRGPWGSRRRRSGAGPPSPPEGGRGLLNLAARGRESPVTRGLQSDAVAASRLVAHLTI
jgi:hypothetical protein